MVKLFEMAFKGFRITIVPDIRNIHRDLIIQAIKDEKCMQRTIKYKNITKYNPYSGSNKIIDTRLYELFDRALSEIEKEFEGATL